MRFSEFIAVPENTASEDAFKALMMLLRQTANDEKEGSTISWDAIATYMNNMGHAMDYNTFKGMYDAKPELKSLVSDEPVDIPPDQVVSKAAKRAMNKRDM
jgi:hypothetical protein